MTSDNPKNLNGSAAGFVLRMNYRVIVVVLLVVIAVMLAIWKPWSSSRLDENRTVKVTGETTVTAVPDEFVFYPTYEFKNTDKQTAINDMTKKSDEIVKKLKELGVADNEVKTSADGNDYSYYYSETDREPTYSLRLTVTVKSREQAQKVQDYLVTTAPLGSIAPQANFSEAKRKELQAKARDEATKDARAKAEQSAKNLGFKLGEVKSVDDGAGFGGIYPMPATEKVTLDMRTSGAPSLGVQPGENDLPYSVTVVYYFR